MLRGGIDGLGGVKMGKLDDAEQPQWWPGCGNFLLLNAVKMAFEQLGLETHEIVVVSGIGCGSKIPHYIRTYGYEGIHGRIIPLAEGIKMANPNLIVVGIGGDGDGFSEGGNHFQHGPRKNVDITYIVQDNSIYALTTGQASPTTHKEQTTKTTPIEKLYQIYKPIPIALTSGATFVAASFVGNLAHLVGIIKKAINHKGFSFVNVYQPCVSWNKFATYEWFMKRVYDLQKEGHDTSDYYGAYKKAMEPYENNFERIPIGVFYENTSLKPLNEIHPTLQKGIYPARKLE